MKLIVGLGNPGRRYAATRHSVGFRIVERFATRWGIELGESRFGGRFGRGVLRGAQGDPLEIAILEPQTFMNRSGAAVAEALGGLGVENPAADLLVVLDDVDLPFGRLRLRPSGGAGGHRGLGDVIEVLGRSDFPRLRFGVGRPPPPLDTAEWVLAPFSEQEAAQLDERLEAASEALWAALLEGVAVAMNRFNRDAAAEGAADPGAAGARRDIVRLMFGNIGRLFSRFVRLFRY